MVDGNRFYGDMPVSESLYTLISCKYLLITYVICIYSGLLLGFQSIVVVQQRVQGLFQITN